MTDSQLIRFARVSFHLDDQFLEQKLPNFSNKGTRVLQNVLSLIGFLGFIPGIF